MNPIHYAIRWYVMIQIILLSIILSCPVAGLAQPSDWLLSEDFENGGGDFDSWFSQSDYLGGAGTDDRGRLDLSSEHSHSGTWSAYMMASESSGYQGASLEWRACDGEQRTNCNMRSFDNLHFRTWILYAEHHSYVHHILNIG